jgi:phospholipase C
MAPHRIPRRTFLKRAAIAGGAVVAAGAGGFGIDRLLTRGSGLSPVPSPYPTAVDTRWPIKRVVYVMLENRSFNHMFAGYPGARNTSRVGLIDNKEVPLVPAPEWLPADLPHDRSAALHDVNGGKMDGFGMFSPGDVPAVKYALSYQERDAVANWWHWAGNFVLCDHFFASANSASYPNHLYMIAGTSGGAFDNPVQSQDQLKVRTDKGLAKTWGCDSPDGAYVDLFDYDTGKKVRGSRPCFTFDTQGQQLTGKGIDWAFYAADDDEEGYIWNAYAAVAGVRNSPLWDEHIRHVDGIEDDIAADRLPSVSWVTPRYELSDHPPYSTIWAENWATEVVSAIMRSPAWRHTVIFVTWDEWGGTYDPVTPPTVDALGLGIRVPMLVISPWANRGMVDHELGEFCSPNKFVADNWGLSYLGPRVERTHNFEHVFDFGRRRSDLLAPDPLPTLKSGPLPERPPGDNVGWPPKVSY